MALPHLRHSSQGIRPSIATANSFLTAFRALVLSQPAIRHASHKSQGAVNSAKDGPGKRLGAKKTDGEQVIPSQIIFRQRGTHWFAGENCALGKDHTVYATAPGFVRYYRDPRLHPKRKYIGVVYDANMQLPTPPGAARRRRFGMDAIQRAPEAEESTDPVLHTSQQENEQIPEKRTVVNSVVIRGRTKKEGPRTLKLGSGYMFRESNWEIGRAAERAGVKPVNFKKGDRFLAWQKREQRKKLVADKQGLGRQKKSKAKR